MTVATGLFLTASNLLVLGVVLVWIAVGAEPNSDARFYCTLWAVTFGFMGILSCVSCIMVQNWGH